MKNFIQDLNPHARASCTFFNLLALHRTSHPLPYAGGSLAKSIHRLSWGGWNKGAPQFYKIRFFNIKRVLDSIVSQDRACYTTWLQCLQRVQINSFDGQHCSDQMQSVQSNVVPHPSTVPSFAQFLDIFGKCIAIIVRAVVNLSKLDLEKTERYEYFIKGGFEFGWLAIFLVWVERVWMLRAFQERGAQKLQVFQKSNSTKFKFRLCLSYLLDPWMNFLAQPICPLIAHYKFSSNLCHQTPLLSYSDRSVSPMGVPAIVHTTVVYTAAFTAARWGS